MTEDSRCSWKAVAMALLALLACDGPWQVDHDEPGVRNASDVVETVSVRTYRSAFACDAVRAGSPAISRAGLDAPRIVTLGSGESVALDASADPDAAATSSNGCGAAVVSSARLLSPLLITWDLRGDAGSVSGADDVHDGQVYLEQFGAELRPSPGRGMVVAEWIAEDALP